MYDTEVGFILTFKCIRSAKLLIVYANIDFNLNGAGHSYVKYLFLNVLQLIEFTEQVPTMLLKPKKCTLKPAESITLIEDKYLEI